MAYASRSGRAFTSPSNPRAFAVCQRCGIWTNRDQLINQQQWRGAALLPLYIFVCRDCLDVPQEQLRAIVLSADPVPITLPFVEPFLQDETSVFNLGNFTTNPQTGIPTYNITYTQSYTGEPYGPPVGLLQPAVMPQAQTDGVTTNYRVPVPVLSVISNGTQTVTVNCSRAHGFVTNDQISVQGLSNVLACGMFSIVVTTATQFTYACFSNVPVGSLLTNSTIMITAQVGLPLGETTIVQVA